MSIEGTALNPVRLVAAALIGLVILLVLIIKFKIQAMVAILIGAISIGLIAGMPFEDIVTAVNRKHIKRNCAAGRSWIYVWRNTGSLGRSPDAGSYNGQTFWR